jgi:gluconate 5-dehydrogenase
VADTYRADGVRVLVTGGTSGLGAAMAAALLDAGAVVAVTGRDGDRARAAADDLAARSGGTVVGIGMDVRDDDAVERGVAEAVAALGRLDVLVNNAGIGMRTVNPRFLTDPQPFWEVRPDGFRDLVATNLTGYSLFGPAAGARRERASGGGQRGPYRTTRP